MAEAPSPAIMRFGTEAPADPVRVLRAGQLTAELDAGNLRHIRFGGVEALRAISYIVRDKNWGTYNPVISDLKVEEGDEGFTVTYQADCRDAEQAFGYRARITGSADGELIFAAEGEALTDFLTNRTGFVVLHGVEGISGRPVEVLHVDGSREAAVFPELIDPVQPFKDIRALTHEVVPGVRATCTMEGDTFEMEDQRNWTDASYKTYVRPLALPWPFTIPKGETLSQRVVLTLEGRAPAAAAGEGAETVTVRLGAPAGPMPEIALAVDPARAEAALGRHEILKRAGAQKLICHFDARAGHGAADMRRFQALGEALGAELVLEAVVPCLDAAGAPTADPTVLEADLAAVAAAARDGGARFSTLAVSPAADLKCTLPGSVWPDTPPAEALYAAARAAFPGLPVGGGMFSYFTELNRKRPPADKLDFVTHTTSAIVHAGDDVSVMETLEALPYITLTARSFIGDRPYWVGPSAIGMRGNPYGAAPMENPEGGRLAMARMDPRQRGLLGAAWTLGYLARMAAGGAALVCPAGLVGEFGLVHAELDYAQPWFDSVGGVYPLFHVVAGLARTAGQTRLAAESDAETAVLALAHRGDGGTALWLANLGPQPRSVAVSGLPGGTARLAVVDEASFAAATRDQASLDALARPHEGGPVPLGAYAVARLSLSD